ncbi:sensor histidine kinase [Inhella gelatinilytica]|uniref:ATP-binding protein n=1 Tax=Inhella gelatinilytica TaxID=2795030 RepID=A0A931IVR3_9BURK|nr:histidine kinase [Inhella gelatinilytica]MBH9553687.1 ATP-binding protein [Inhella gelatinilytica]
MSPTAPVKPWIDRLTEPALALRVAALAICVLELGSAFATLAGAATEPYDGLIAQAWAALGGSPRNPTPLLLSLMLLGAFAWLLWRLARPQHIDTPPRHALRWLLLLDGLAFAVTPGLPFLVTAMAAVLLRARPALIFAVCQVLLALANYLWLPNAGQRQEQIHQGLFYGVTVTTMAMLALHGLAFGLGRLTAAQADKRRWLQAVLAERLSAEQLHDEQLRYSERLVIARELHDLMGHHLAALNLQLQLGEALAARGDAAGALPALGKAREVAQQLLDDVRSAVSAQRETPRIELRAALEALAAAIDSPRIRLDLEPEASRDLGPRSAHALLRCVQEAVTNAVRHARARHLDISMRRDGPGLVVRVSDDGAGVPRLAPGNGLSGMRERVEELGGSLTVLRHQPGFELELRLPRQREH